MTSPVNEFVNSFACPAVRDVLWAVDSYLRSQGCQAYVKTIYVGYDLSGLMVAAAYPHSEHVEVALALPEAASDVRLHDASHLTWRTLPWAINLRTAGEMKASESLFTEAVMRVREGIHDVARNNEYFTRRAQQRRRGGGE